MLKCKITKLLLFFSKKKKNLENPDIRKTETTHFHGKLTKGKFYNETHIKVVLGVIKSKIQRHVCVIDVHIHKLHNILVRYLPQQLHQSTI